MGRILSSILLRSASNRASGSGIHVPRFSLDFTIQIGSIPCYPTLIFSITTLHLLVYTFLYFPFENPSPRRLVKACYFKDMCCIDPIVGPPPHQTFAINFKLIDRNLRVARNVKCISKLQLMKTLRVKELLTPL